jgi:DNA polymerase III delta prime subunit
MALMMPRFISSANSPPGELKVFNALKDCPLAKDWIVLHSLDLANHTTQISGEADFVIIVPDLGILVLEVKSHKYIKYEHGNWWLGNNPQPETRGPFKQALNAMHSIRKYVDNHSADLGNTFFTSAVCFSDANFSQRSPEWHNWEIIDKELFERHEIGLTVSNILKKAHELAESKNIRLRGPNPEASEQLAKILRPSAEAIPSAKAIRKELDNELKECTDEQFHALDAMADNPKNIFNGPAGCGKTTLAVELARRYQETGKAKDTLFLCFNNLLHRSIEEEISLKAPDITFSTFHKFLLEQTKLKPKERDLNDSVFWNEILPETAMEMHFNQQLQNFGYLILDEAQDLFQTNYLDALDLYLEGGFKNSNWNIFGDFSNQDIFSKGEITIEDFKSKWAQNFSTFKLSINCRNTVDIASYVEGLGRMTPPYRKTLRQGNEEPNLSLYSDINDETSKVKKCIGMLLKKGIRTHDIVILHPQKDACPVVQSLNEDPDFQTKISPYTTNGTGIRHCSIQKFKGLESSAVIIADFDELRSSYQVSLFYIGLSRALNYLNIFAHKNLRETILSHL